MTNIHKITLFNIHRDKVYNYSIFYLRGVIENAGVHCNSKRLYAYTENGTIKGTYKIDCNGHVFRCLVELQQGDNLITVNCNCSSVQIVVTYVFRETEFTVLPLYMVSNESDMLPSISAKNNSIESNRKKIILGCKILQLIFASLLDYAGYSPKTFSLHPTGCSLFYSNLTSADIRRMKRIELWTYIAKEIMTSPIGNNNTKYIVFLSSSNNQEEKLILIQNIFHTNEEYIAYGGGGLALLGTDCLVTWPENVSDVLDRFQDKRKMETVIGSSIHGDTIGGCFASTLGSVLHELCHTFDLGHTKTGIMGQGFNNIQDYFLRDYQKNLLWNTKKIAVQFNWTNSSAAILNYHKWLNNYKNYSNDLKFDSNTLFIKSSKGIRAIEIRMESDELVLKSWIFNRKVLKYHFQIPIEECTEINLKYCLIFCIDNVGNTLKVSAT